MRTNAGPELLISWRLQNSSSRIDIRYTDERMYAGQRWKAVEECKHGRPKKTVEKVHNRQSFCFKPHLPSARYSDTSYLKPDNSESIPFPYISTLVRQCTDFKAPNAQHPQTPTMQIQFLLLATLALATRISLTLSWRPPSVLGAPFVANGNKVMAKLTFPSCPAFLGVNDCSLVC